MSDATQLFGQYIVCMTTSGIIHIAKVIHIITLHNLLHLEELRPHLGGIVPCAHPILHPTAG